MFSPFITLQFCSLAFPSLSLASFAHIYVLYAMHQIRVHNLCLMAASDPADVFRLADLDAIFATKLVAFEGPQGGNGLLPSLVQRGGGSPLVPGTAGPLSQSLELEAARERLTEECAHGLHGYRAICAKGEKEKK